MADSGGADGTGVRLRRAENADIDSVVDLLCRAFPRGPRRLQWHPLFERPWDDDALEDSCFGYLLEAGDRIVGYIGTIFAVREIGGEEVVSCNLSSWCVEPEYRAMGGGLLLAAMRQRKAVLTAFTPSPAVQVICETLGFTRMSGYKLLLPALAQSDTLLCRGRVLDRPADLDNILSAKERRIRADHVRFPLGHYVVTTNRGYAYIVTKRGLVRGLPTSQVLFCSHPAILGEQLERFKLTVFARERSLALVILPNLVSPEPRGAIRLNRPSYVKSASVPCPDIDLLYSEFALLP